MIEQYLSNNNETATVAFCQKFCQLNSPLVFFEKKGTPKDALLGRIQI
jgi:hypothetical protein